MLHATGDTNGALTLLGDFPNFGQTSGCMSEQLFEYETQESKDWCKRNLYGLADGLAIKLVKHYWFDDTLSENKEQTIESVADKVKKIYEDSHNKWAEQFMKENLNISDFKLNPSVSMLLCLSKMNGPAEILIHCFGFVYYSHDALMYKPIIKIPNPIYFKEKE